jgi:hypothetical protein
VQFVVFVSSCPEVVLASVHVIVAGIWRHVQPDGSTLVLRKSVPWPDELLKEPVGPRMIRSHVLLGGYLVQPQKGGCLG